MGVTMDVVAPVIGQTLTDPYGRKIGVLVSAYSDIEGNVTSIEIMINDSQYETLPAERLEQTVEGLKVLPQWLVEAKKLERKLDILKKRLKAMEELYKKGQIPAHAYRELKERYTKEVEKIRVDSKNLRDVLRKRIYELENFIIHIEKAMTHLMVNYTAGEIPESGFKISADLMRFARQAAIEEKKDVEKHTGLIEKLEQELMSIVTSEEESSIAASSVQQDQSEPIAVKVVS